MPDNGPNDYANTVSDWVKAVRSLIQIRIHKLSGSINMHTTSIFKYPEVSKDLTYLHEKYVVVPADKAQNNIGVFFVKKTLYRLFDTGTKYWQFTWQPNIYTNYSHKKGNP